MKECEICGNEIAFVAAVCPFCRSAQTETASSPSSRRPRSVIRTLNVKENRPTVEEGIARLKQEMLRARQDGVRLARIIHGYGSRGKGGELRMACREFLANERQGRRIRSFIEGEQYTDFNPIARALVKRYPDLRRTRRTDTGNPGMTWVEL